MTKTSTPDGRVARALLASAIALVLALLPSGVCSAQESKVLDWETGAGKSYVIPAAEILAFIVGLNLFNRNFIDEKDYDSDWDSVRKNLRTGAQFDKDPFSVNQLGHPYQGGIYYGLARSAGLGYWESLLYTLGGSLIWETVGETTPPSLNDHVATGVGGTFVGEALFRMASLLLEGAVTRRDSGGSWARRRSRRPPASIASCSASGSVRSFRAATRPCSFA